MCLMCYMCFMCFICLMDASLACWALFFGNSFFSSFFFHCFLPTGFKSDTIFSPTLRRIRGYPGSPFSTADVGRCLGAGFLCTLWIIQDVESILFCAQNNHGVKQSPPVKLREPNWLNCLLQPKLRKLLRKQRTKHSTGSEDIAQVVRRIAVVVVVELHRF